MEPVALDPTGYAGTYKLVGGRPSLDLVNTVSWPFTDRRHDWLCTGVNVERWLRAVGLPSVTFDDGDLVAVRRIRQTIDDLLRPLAAGDRPGAPDVDRFNAVLSRAAGRRRLDHRSLRPGWPAPRTATDALDPVVVDAEELAAAPGHDRLRHCPACAWLFEDHSRSGSRRWCDMADCGSRAKSREHYRRTQRRGNPRDRGTR